MMDKLKVDDFRKVVIAIGAYKLTGSPEVFEQELRFSEEAGSGGWVIFHYASLADNRSLAGLLPKK